MMPEMPHDRMMTPAARSTLDEYADQYRARILDEALHLSPGDTLSPRDIVNARDAIEARSYRTPDTAVPMDEYRSLRLRSALSIALSLVLVAAAILLAFILVPQNRPLNSAAATAALGGAAALISAGAAFLVIAWGERRRQRQAVRERFVRRELELLSQEMRAQDASVVDESPTFEVFDNDFLTRARFLNSWGRVEERLRSLAQNALGMTAETSDSYPIGSLLDQLVRSGVTENTLSTQVRDLLHLRNKVVHMRPVSSTELRVGVDMIPAVERSLQHSIDLHPPLK